MSRPTCIVCGKPIAKRTKTIYFKQATDKNPHGTRKGEMGSMLMDLFVDEKPVNKADAQRLVNYPIVSVSRHQGHIYSVGVWDGESYTDLHFHSEGCAAIHGRRMAKRGYL